MQVHKFTVVFEPEEGRKNVYNAHIPALRGCCSFGESLNEARYNIQEAAELYLEHLLEEGLAIPKDKKVKVSKRVISEEMTIGVDFEVRSGFDHAAKMAYA